MKINIHPYKRLLLVMSIVACFLFSCKKFVEIPPAPDLLETASVFSDESTATSAVDGVYLLMRTASPSFANGLIGICTSLSGDELDNLSGNTTYAVYAQDNIPSNDATATGLWRTAYTTIYRANAILGGLQVSTNISGAVKKQLEGEMKVVRALHYFYLVNLFGNVPLVVQTDYKVNESLPRTASADVYKQIIADLTDAQNLLTEDYPSDERARPNKYTATALLARVYLYQKNWQGAVDQSSAIINAGVYNLGTDLSKVFLTGSNETIWQIASPNAVTPAAEAGAFIPFSLSGLPSFSVDTALLNAFETGDQRKVNWINSVTVSGSTWYYPFKYRNRLRGTVTEDEIVFRLAELYLIRAEGSAALNDFATATADLNTIRQRAGLSPTTANDKTTLLAAVMQERRTELFTEWGHRWLDVIRTGVADNIFGHEKKGWKSSDILYPIPYAEMLLNPFLTQNDGY